MQRTSVPAAQAHGHDDDHHHDHEHVFEWPEMGRIAAVALAAVAAWFRLWEPLPGISLIGVAGLAIGGWPIPAQASDAENVPQGLMEAGNVTTTS